MIYRPPKKSAPKRGGGGARRTSGFILPPSLKPAYRDLQAIARDPREPSILRALARATCVLLHRVLMIIATSTVRCRDEQEAAL